MKKIEHFTGQSFNSDYTKENYDLYSNICSYKKAFTKAEMQGDYFSSPTVKFLKFIYERNKTQIFFCVLFSIVYAFEYFKNTYFQKRTN